VALFGSASTTTRFAKDVGLYHYTSLANNTKQANNYVNIGPAFVALDATGKPLDSNAIAPDGIPDFIADRSGDGMEGSDEVRWQSQNNGSLAILSPVANSTVSGIVRVRVSLPFGAASLDAMYLLAAEALASYLVVLASSGGLRKACSTTNQPLVPVDQLRSGKNPDDGRHGDIRSVRKPRLAPASGNHCQPG
jgi:hypothetical protein